MENIQLDLAVISTDSTRSNATEQGNNNASETSRSPFFSKVLAKEQSPERTTEKSRIKEGGNEQRSEKIASKNGDSEQGSEKTTEKKSNDEQTSVADGKSLPEENTELPQDTAQKAEVIPLLLENELNTPELPSEQTIAEAPNIIIEEDSVETIENLGPQDDNIIPIAIPTEAKETEPTLKVGNTPEALVTNIEMDTDMLPQSSLPESDTPEETVVALNPQQMASVKPPVEPENKTTKIVQKSAEIDKLSLVNTKTDAEILPETTDPDTLLEEPEKPEMPVQSPIARALVKEFSDVQSNGGRQNTLANEIGIKLGDIQSNATRPPVQLVNNVQTSPLPAVTIDRPGWEQSFANNVSWMNNENVQTANIRISPSDLGPLEIKMTIKQDQLNLSINAHHALTRETLENAMPRLREVLANNGYNSVNVDVSGQQTNGGNAENNASTGSEWSGANEGSEFESEQGGENLMQPEQRMGVATTGSGMVDIFA